MTQKNLGAHAGALASGALRATPESSPAQLAQRLGLLTATTLVMGSMIGSGIFIVTADMARLVGSPALLLTAWLVSGALTIAGALCYGELAAMMPKAGGQYVYLKEALGPLWGFLFGWTFFLVIQTGTIAAVAVAFGKFFGWFFPSVTNTQWLWHIAHVPAISWGPLVLGNMDMGLNTQNLVAIAVVWLLTLINIFGVRFGAWVQNFFTITKVLALLGLIAVGLLLGRNADVIAANFGEFWRNAGFLARHPVQLGLNAMGEPILLWVSSLVIVGVAQVGSLFSSDAWNNVTFTAGEIKQPQRNLPLSLALGTGVVIVLYLLCNIVYLCVLPLNGSPDGSTIMARGIQYATQDRVATAVLQQMFGPVGAAWMATLILISTFGCNNGLVLAGARVYYAMAKDRLFFATAARVHPRYDTPATALVMQAAWASLLCLSGSYGQLLDYIIFAVLLFYLLTVFSLFVLRVKRPAATRPYRTLGYPVLPAAYIAVVLAIEIILLLYKPQYTWPGLCIVLLGVPVYYLGVRRPKSLVAQQLSS